MKRLLLFVTVGLLSMSCLLAQQTITGTVTDAVTQNPVEGAAVLVKGTTIGAYTDASGYFKLEAPADASVLIFNMVGKRTVEQEIGDRTTIDVALKADDLVLEEVVVTGLGIKREKKALGFGVSTISSDLVENRSESDVARILRGKATGVNITQTSGLAGSGTNIIIRGFSSISGTNQPLFVIDGIPFNTDTNNDQTFGSGGATASSRFLDLDPNNIAEVSILKGLSATVLYGEAGRNGVILVTTKNGTGGAGAQKGLEVNFTQNVAFSEVANIPDYQNTFGNGFNAGFGWFFSNWGADFSDTNPGTYGSDFIGVDDQGRVLITHPYDQPQYVPDFGDTYTGVPYVYQPYKSVENFFDRGTTINTSVSAQSKLGDNSSVSATYSFLRDEGFTPNLDEKRGGGASNFLEKQNFGLGAQTTFANGIKLKGTFNYVDSDRRTPLTSQAFGGAGNGLFAAILFTPRSIDLMNLPYESPVDGSNVYYRRGSAIQNPRWILNNAGDYETVKRFFSTIELSYEFTPWLTGLFRLGTDQYTQNVRREQNKGGVSTNPDGILQTSNRRNNITDQLYNLIYDFNLSSDITLDGVIGANLRRETRQAEALVSTQQFIYGLFTHNNYIEHQGFSGRTEENTIGIYATATVGYKDFLYLNLQGRNDFTSTLESENNSIFYPSASLAFLPTEAIPSLQAGGIMNYLKLRVGLGTSAGYPNPYQTRNVLSSATNVFQTAGGSVLNINSVSNVLGNANLTPELHTEFETGLEARFFNSRVGVDFSFYDKQSSDLIIAQDLDPSTGFTTTTTNAAKIQNIGVELGLNITPVQGDFTWEITLNYTRNRSEVLEIADGVDQIQVRTPGDPLFGSQLAGFNGSLGNYAIKGQPYGVIQGEPFQRTDAGELILDGVGNPIPSGDLEIIGDPNPDFLATWINTFSWKGLSVGFQWDYVHGGDLYSSTAQALIGRGNTVDTDVDRFLPLVLPGVKQSDGQTNDIQTYIGDSFFRAYFFADEGGVFDATTIRLREVSLAYVLPKEIVDKTPFGRIALTLSGQNLWYNAPNFPEGLNFDPEVASTGVGNSRGFDFRTAPTSKRYGATLNLSF